MDSNDACQCQSGAHGHEPGKCQNPPKNGGICEDCIAKDLPANTPPWILPQQNSMTAPGVGFGQAARLRTLEK